MIGDHRPQIERRDRGRHYTPVQRAAIWLVWFGLLAASIFVLAAIAFVVWVVVQ